MSKKGQPTIKAKSKAKKKDTSVYAIDDFIHSPLNQNKIKNTIFQKFFSYINSLIQSFQAYISHKKEERLTIMFIPHNENKIKNFHISNLSLSLIILGIILLVTINALFIIHHSSTVQKVDKLKKSQKDTRIQFTKIKEEINAISRTYGDLKENLRKIDAIAKEEQYSSTNENFTDSNMFASPISKISPKLADTNNTLPIVDSIDTNEGNTKDTEVVPNEIFMLDRMVYDMSASKNILESLSGYIKKRIRSIQNSPTLWPVYGYVVNPYGLIRKSNELTAVFNSGVDIASGPGAKVVATASGYITDIKYNRDENWIVRIRHNYGYETVYKGMSRLIVQKDVTVVKGEQLGYIGASSNTSESILHYQVFIGTEAQNPLPYMNYIAD